MEIDYNIPILLIDDYKTMLKIITNLLQSLGFNNIVHVLNGEQALDKLNNHIFDLIICDWNLEPMSAQEIVKNIKNNPNTASIPILMIVAAKDMEDIQHMQQELGFKGVIKKPFSKEELLSTLKNL